MIFLEIKSKIITQSRVRCKFRVLYDECSVANIPRGVQGTRVNPDTCRICVDGQIRFPERKICGLKNIRISVDEATINHFLFI